MFAEWQHLKHTFPHHRWSAKFSLNVKKVLSFHLVLMFVSVCTSPRNVIDVRFFRVPILKIKKLYFKTFALFRRAFSLGEKRWRSMPSVQHKQQGSFKNRVCRHNKPHDTLQYVSFIFRLVSTQTLGTRHFNSFQGMKCFHDALKLGLVVFIWQRLFCVDKLVIRRFVNNVD